MFHVSTKRSKPITGTCGKMRDPAPRALGIQRNDTKTGKSSLSGSLGCGSKNRYQNGILVSGNMAQNLHNFSCLILSHTHFISNPIWPMLPSLSHRNRLWDLEPRPSISARRPGQCQLRRRQATLLNAFIGKGVSSEPSRFCFAGAGGRRCVGVVVWVWAWVWVWVCECGCASVGVGVGVGVGV